MTDFMAKNAPNSISAGAPPQTPLRPRSGSLQRPQTPSCIWGPTSKGSGGKGWRGPGGEGREGRGAFPLFLFYETTSVPSICSSIPRVGALKSARFLKPLITSIQFDLDRQNNLVWW